MVGSTWHRWDLHVHTPASFENQFSLKQAATEDDYQRLIWERYIAALEAHSSVPVVGITDYFSVEGYKKIRAYKAQGRLANYDLILPNIEFRLDTIFTRDKGKVESVNYHIIFSDQLDAEIIEQEFLSCLEIKTATSEPRRLTKTNIEAIGHQLKKQQESFQKDSDYKVGCMNIKVSFDRIHEVLKRKPELFDGKYLTVLAFEGFKRKDWEGQVHLEWKRLLAGSDAVFSGHPQTREYMLGRLHESPERFLASFKTLKPCLHGSDAHTFEKLFKPDLDRYCWVKGDLSFAGLRQVLYEPDTRVAISPTRPDSDRSAYTLTEVKLANTEVNGNLTLSSDPLPLNHGLIAAIGGKGSGKTALLDLIAHCFEDRCQRGKKDRKDTSSFVQRIEREQPDLATSIRFLKDEQWTKRLQDTEVFERSRATYLPQGKIDEYSADTQKLHRKITELVFSTEDVARSGLTELYESLGKDIQQLQTDITKTIGSIESHEAETTHEQHSELSKSLELKRGDLDDLVRRRDQHLIDEAHKQRVEELDDNLAELEAQNKVLEQLNTDINEFRANLSKLSEMNIGAKGLSNRLGEAGWNGELPPIDFALLQAELKSAEAFLQAQKDSVSTTIAERRQELAGLSQNQQEHGALLDQIERKEEEIRRSEAELEAFEKKQRDTEATKIRCTKLYRDYLEKVHRQRDVYSQIIDLFSQEKDQIMKVIEFQARVTFARDDFIETAQDLFHGRSVSDNDISEMAATLEKLGQAPDEDVLADAYFAQVLKFSDKTKTRRTLGDLYRFMLQPAFRVETNVLFDGKQMESLSMGQKGTVLLTIFLAEGDHLLILDQPEENLDNRFVYEVLVGAIRAAKQRRQILMATHNANLVVNTDAEQVIVANYDNGAIKYVSGALENENIRKEVTTLLEGGEEAFRQRELRYRG